MLWPTSCLILNLSGILKIGVNLMQHETISNFFCCSGHVIPKHDGLSSFWGNISIVSNHVDLVVKDPGLLGSCAKYPGCWWQLFGINDNVLIHEIPSLDLSQISFVLHTHEKFGWDAVEGSQQDPPTNWVLS